MSGEEPEEKAKKPPKAKAPLIPIKHSRVGPDFQVALEELAAPAGASYPRPVAPVAPWPDAEPPDARPAPSPRLAREGAGAAGAPRATPWRLEPVAPSARTAAAAAVLGAPGAEPGDAPRAARAVELLRGSNIVGRTRETQLVDLRLSRQHVDVYVDERNDVWVLPLYRYGDVVTLNERLIKKMDGRRQVSRGDVVCLWKDEFGFRLELARPSADEARARERRAARGFAEDPVVASAECLWRPPRDAATRAACDALLDGAEPGAEAGALFALYGAGYDCGDDGAAAKAARAVGGSRALAQRWEAAEPPPEPAPAPAAAAEGPAATTRASAAAAAPPATGGACLGASMLRHRKSMRFVSLELALPVGDVLNYYYAVYKPRSGGSYARFKADMAKVQHAQRTRDGGLVPSWHKQLPDVPLVDDGNADHCDACRGGGELLCCDTCERAYHLECCGLAAIPEGDWSCPKCHAALDAARRAAPAQ